MYRYKYDPIETDPSHAYTKDQHATNVAFATNYLDRFGFIEAGNTVEHNATPWMITSGGLSRVITGKKGLQAEIVEEREQGFYDLAAHFVKTTVELGDSEMRAVSLVYPSRLQQFTMHFNRPISMGMFMGYPTPAADYFTVGKLLKRNFALDKGSELETQDASNSLAYDEVATRVSEERPFLHAPATPNNVSGLFAAEPRRLRNWVKVKL